MFHQLDPIYKWSLGVLTFFLIIMLIVVLLFWRDVSKYDQLEADGKKREAAIILGAAVWKDQPSPALRERLDKGAELYEKGLVSYLILSGGKGTLKKKSEAQVMKEYLLKRQIPEEDLILEDQSTNTQENLLNTRKILDQHHLKQIYLVTHDYHMHRALIYAKQAHITASPAPVHSQVLWLPYHKFRECFAMIKLHIFG
ncbi:YdcF family protein [Thermoflavimicrobium dichotomicum]|uniref:Uncharacterized SAM-binding protein YcdF, DUF218 family n=1 Tax=Thermoflavimicrobium dichotomicum TaxID=46223 RepID=A0A1I3RM76_9BACL|nr:YdcF family protein [Thermoflavimicrobium dichotomicum]SFJ47348.1 Uncharacterized SAM-binding protein YcdF, DUF218 family [Thermoflavimicrobium dichotomicum]